MEFGIWISGSCRRKWNTKEPALPAGRHEEPLGTCLPELTLAQILFLNKVLILNQFHASAIIKNFQRLIPNVRNYLTQKLLVGIQRPKYLQIVAFHPLGTIKNIKQSFPGGTNFPLDCAESVMTFVVRGPTNGRSHSFVLDFFGSFCIKAKRA